MRERRFVVVSILTTQTSVLARDMNTALDPQLIWVQGCVYELLRSVKWSISALQSRKYQQQLLWDQLTSGWPADLLSWPQIFQEIWIPGKLSGFRKVSLFLQAFLFFSSFFLSDFFCDNQIIKTPTTVLPSIHLHQSGLTMATIIIIIIIFHVG